MPQTQMKFLARILCAAALLVLCSLSHRAQAQRPLLLENPTVSRTQIAFSYGGDIWIVERSGGNARRLTESPAREIYPIFSPDGTQVAFARFNPAAGLFGWDVFVVTVSNGEEHRVTYHPDLDLPVNWTPDGKC